MTTTGKVTGVVYADKDGKQQRQKARLVAVAGNSIESPRLLLNSASTMFPDGLANSSGQVGRNYMRHTTGSVYAHLRQAGADVARHDDGGHHPRRGPARPDARLRRRLRARDAVARPAVHGGLPRSRRLGPRLHLGARRLRQHGRACGSSARTCRRRPTAVTLHTDVEGRARHADRRRAFRRPPQRRRHAQPRLRAGRGDLRGGRRGAHLPDAALSVDPQSRHQPDEREPAGRRRQQVRPERTTSRTSSSPTAASSPPARRRTRRSPSWRWRSGRPTTSPGSCRRATSDRRGHRPAPPLDGRCPPLPGSRTVRGSCTVRQPIRAFFMPRSRRRRKSPIPVHGMYMRCTWIVRARIPLIPLEILRLFFTLRRRARSAPSGTPPRISSVAASARATSARAFSTSAWSSATRRPASSSTSAARHSARLPRLLGGMQLRRQVRRLHHAPRPGGVDPPEEPAQDPAEQEGPDQRPRDRQRQLIPIHRRPLPPRRPPPPVKAIRRFCARPSAVRVVGDRLGLAVAVRGKPRKRQVFRASPPPAPPPRAPG